MRMRNASKDQSDRSRATEKDKETNVKLKAKLPKVVPESVSVWDYISNLCTVGRFLTLDGGTAAAVSRGCSSSATTTTASMYKSSSHMGSAEREKLLGENGNRAGLTGMIARQTGGKVKQWIVGGTILLLVLFFWTSSKDYEYRYGIMFDAGSTGSRIHVYKFHEDSAGTLKLDDELFEQIKPGLSSYPDKVDGAVASIQSLIDKALAYIPADKQKNTPLALKASAGLRILGPEKSEPILNGVDKLLGQQTPFRQLWHPEIMDGTKEAVYSWVTLNFLADVLAKKGSTAKDTFGTLDLGGGSTQIAFAPSQASTKSSAPDGWVVKEKAFGKEWEVYIHSYLGLGLMSARELMLNGPHENTAADISSDCFNAKFDNKWENARSTYNIKGAGMDFSKCYAKAKSVIKGKSVDSPKEIADQTFYAFSYYFDRAVEVGLITDKGGDVTVMQFKEAAEKACKTKLSSENGDWLCMDLSVISALLSEGFGFHDTTTLRLYKKINGIETQWSLGATFALFAEGD